MFEHTVWIRSLGPLYCQNFQIHRLGFCPCSSRQTGNLQAGSRVLGAVNRPHVFPLFKQPVLFLAPLMQLKIFFLWHVKSGFGITPQWDTFNSWLLLPQTQGLVTPLDFNMSWSTVVFCVHLQFRHLFFWGGGDSFGDWTQGFPQRLASILPQNHISSPVSAFLISVLF